MAVQKTASKVPRAKETTQHPGLHFRKSLPVEDAGEHVSVWLLTQKASCDLGNPEEFS